jgi:hypothetical protein
LVATIYWSDRIQGTDYLSSFYVAARLVWDGRSPEIYPDVSATSFSTAPLNRFAHELLPHLSHDATSAYMYGPLVAWLLAPLSTLSPGASMVAWQLISIGALVFCAFVLSRGSQRSVAETLWVGVLYVPIFHTLMIGHIGITFGLAPLCAGYMCLRSNRPVLAGLAWSLLLLKPQFLPTVLLIVGALALNARLLCAVGFISGLVLVTGLSAACLSPQVMVNWMASLRLSDAIFSDPQYRYPVHLVASLPAAALHALPPDLREVAKLTGYGVAALVGIHALWRSWELLRAEEPDSVAARRLVFLLGISVLPLVVPHFLSYDLSVFAVAGILATNNERPSAEADKLRRISHLYLLAINTYVALFVLPWARLAQPLLLVFALMLLYGKVLRIVQERTRKARTLSTLRITP